MAQGSGNKAIAEGLGMFEHTVKFRIGSIFNTLNVSSRTEPMAEGGPCQPDCLLERHPPTGGVPSPPRHPRLIDFEPAMSKFFVPLLRAMGMLSAGMRY